MIFDPYFKILHNFAAVADLGLKALVATLSKLVIMLSGANYGLRMSTPPLPQTQCVDIFSIPIPEARVL